VAHEYVTTPWGAFMPDEYYAKQKSEMHRMMQAAPPAAAPAPPPARTIDAGLQHLGQGLALATELLGTLEEHLDPVLAHVPVQEQPWPLVLEPTCALAQQVCERIEQVQHLSARLSAVLERLAL
jgi:hypothetical protein